MLQQMYAVLTKYEGGYLLYLIPIVYFLSITFKVVSSQMKTQRRLGLSDVVAVVAVSLIFLDFINYLYLFFTKTGQLLSPTTLFIKYVVGACLWLWVLWYSYNVYFARHAAGDNFKKRQISLTWLCVGSLTLGVIGVVISLN